MSHALEKAALLLLPYRQRKQQRILSLLPTARAASISEKLIKIDELSLRLEDFTQQKLPLTAFNCHTKADVELLRLHSRDTDNRLSTHHTKQLLLNLIATASHGVEDDDIVGGLK